MKMIKINLEAIDGSHNIFFSVSLKYRTVSKENSK